jgi:hypothetical protein
VQSYSASLRLPGYDNLLALKLGATSMDKLREMGVKKVIHTRKVWTILQEITVEEIVFHLLEQQRRFALPLTSFLCACFEMGGLEEERLVEYVKCLEESGVTSVEELALLTEVEVAGLPFLEGHLVALMHVHATMVAKLQVRNVCVCVCVYLQPVTHIGTSRLLYLFKY